MKKVLTITNSINTKVELIVCKTIEEAIEKMKMLYHEKCNNIKYDINNTYLDEEEEYAQIVDGLEQIEYRIGSIC